MAKKRAHRPEGYSPAPPPAARAATAATPGRRGTGVRPGGARPSARTRFEAASTPALLRVQLMPAFVVPVLLALLLFFGLVIPQPWAGSLLIVIALFLAWLTAISWPGISAGSRILRVAVDVGILALGVMKLSGRF